MSATPWPLPRLRTSFLLLVAVGATIMGNELNRLVDEVLSSDGHVHSLGDLTGPAAGTQIGNWAAWSSSATTPATFILVATLLDLVFIACYGILGFRLITVASNYWATGLWANNHPNLPAPAPLAARRLLWALIVADLLEDALLLFFAIPLYLRAGAAWDHDQWGWFVAIATYAKLLSLVILVLYFIFSDIMGCRIRSWVPLALKALYAQRITALVVAAIGLLTLLPLPNLFEQASDSFRAWLTYPIARAHPLIGGPVPAIDLRAIGAVVGDILVGLMLFAISRGRVRHYARQTGTFVREDAALRPWFLAAGILAVLAIIVGLSTNWASIDWIPLAIVLAVILAVPSVSLLLRKRGIVMPEPLNETTLSGRAEHVKIAGDLLVAVWAPVSFFGPLKAFVSPLFLSIMGVFDGSRFSASLVSLIVLEAGLLALGVWFAIWQWTLMRAPATVPAEGAARRTVRTFVGTVGSTDPNLTEQSSRTLESVGRLMFGTGVTIVIVLLVFPNLGGALLGPVPALVILIGSWAAILGTLVRVLGGRQPIEAFAFLRLRATPIVALLVVVPLVISFIDGPAALHALRFAASETADPAQVAAHRLDLKAAFKSWNSGQAGCATTFTGSPNGDVSVRPLVLVAAQGGGIRAATWTVDVLRQLPGSGSCAGGSVFLSSGASGGSIGLATFRAKGSTVSDITQLDTLAYGGPVALGTVVTSLLDGDIFGGVTGIRVPTQTNPNNILSPWTWHDRTALQELTWESEAPQLAKPIDLERVKPTGYLVLNSTDSVSSCKVVVSQLYLGATSRALTPDCNGPSTGLSNTLDLRDTIGKCFYDLNWSTAAELSARFPIISPPARISPETLPANCRKNLAQMQLVDGGTTDNSAIGTISDIAPELTSIITTFNAKQTGSTDKPFVVPVILYATNDPGLDLTATANRIQPDALVPLSVLKRSQAAEITPSAWLSRVTNGYSQVCGIPAKKANCSAAVSAVNRWVSGGAVVVSPSTEPAISVPLGWTLSGFSRTQLRLQALDQAQCGRVSEGTDTVPTISKVCRSDSDYGMFGSLLSLYSADAKIVSLDYPAK